MKLLSRSKHVGYLLIGALVILSTLLTACSGAQKAQSPEPSGSPSASSAPAASPSASSGPSTNLAKDQVFHFSLLGEPHSIDPGLDEDTNMETVIKQLWTGLVQYKPDLTVEPAVAEKWDVSPDAKTWTFTLKDTKWSDGSPVTAGDFEYAIKRMLDPKFASPYAEFLYDIKGAQAYNQALGTKSNPKNPSDADLAKLRDAVGVKAIDDHTLRFDLANPASYFLTLLAQGNLSPIKKSVVDKYGDQWTEPGHIVSNGPFILKSWVPGSKMILERNPYYFGKQPTLQSIELTFMQDETAAYAAYQNNELDVSASIPDAQIPQIRSDPTLSKQVRQWPQLATYYVGFNVKQKPFNDKRVRQAFQMAIDTKTLCDKVLDGIPMPAKSFIPPGMPGYQPNIGFDFNPQKAKQLLAEAGYPDGKGFPKVTLAYNTDPGNQLRMEYIQAQLKENLGVNISLENWESKSYFRNVATDHPQMFRLGWNADYPHPNDWLRLPWETGSGENFGQYSDPAYDALIEKAAAEPDQQKQLTLYAQAQKLLVDDAPALWIYYYRNFRLVKPWVQGFQTTAQDPYPGAFFWKDISILAH